MVRQDRFPPLSKYPATARRYQPNSGLLGKRPAPPYKLAMGAPTAAENKLVYGDLYDTHGVVDPMGASSTFLGDQEKPAEMVLRDSHWNNFLHKQQGEPISDPFISNWDMQSGIYDGTY